VDRDGRFAVRPPGDSVSVSRDLSVRLPGVSAVRRQREIRAVHRAEGRRSFGELRVGASAAWFEERPLRGAKSNSQRCLAQCLVRSCDRNRIARGWLLRHSGNNDLSRQRVADACSSGSSPSIICCGVGGHPAIRTVTGSKSSSGPASASAEARTPRPRAQLPRAATIRGSGIAS
jgi:hypothetical protein